jgi:hypothetical protein
MAAPQKKGKDSKPSVIIVFLKAYWKDILKGIILGIVTVGLTIYFIKNKQKQEEAKKLEYELSLGFTKKFEEHIRQSLKNQAFEEPKYYNLINKVLEAKIKDKKDEMDYLRSLYKTDDYGVYLRFEVVLESAREFRKRMEKEKAG